MFVHNLLFFIVKKLKIFYNVNMKLILANKEDLKEIKILINKSILNMNNLGIKIWNEYYPNECFLGDIENNNLYLLKKDNKIISVATMCSCDESGNEFKWSGTKNSKFLTRFAVSVDFLNMGYGKLMLKNLIELAQGMGIESLRLAVAKVNTPAIKLYEKFGFKKVEGSFFNEFITECDNEEYGYELLLEKDTD